MSWRTRIDYRLAKNTNQLEVLSKISIALETSEAGWRVCPSCGGKFRSGRMPFVGSTVPAHAGGSDWDVKLCIHCAQHPDIVAKYAPYPIKVEVEPHIRTKARANAVGEREG